MYNLLPYQQKKSLKREYYIRLATVSVSIITILGIFLFLTLLPSYFLSLSKKESSAKQLALARAKVADQKIENHISFTELRSLSDAVLKKIQSRSLNSIIEQILRDKTSGIKITGFDITAPNDAGLRTVGVVGVADNRSSILEFAKKLQADQLFKKVDVPDSNFQKSKNILFTITLTVTP